MNSQKNPEQTNKQTTKICNNLPKKQAAKKKNNAWFKTSKQKNLFSVDDFLFGSAVILLSTFANDKEK